MHISCYYLSDILTFISSRDRPCILFSRSWGFIMLSRDLLICIHIDLLAIGDTQIKLGSQWVLCLGLSFAWIYRSSQCMNMIARLDLCCTFSPHTQSYYPIYGLPVICAKKQVPKAIINSIRFLVAGQKAIIGGKTGRFFGRFFWLYRFIARSVPHFRRQEIEKLRAYFIVCRLLSVLGLLGCATGSSVSKRFTLGVWLPFVYLIL